MTLETCANCGSPLPADQPDGGRYCEKCSAAWHRGDDRPEQDAPDGDHDQAGAGQCANCGAELPADQPAGHHYCAKCAAAWQRGKTRQKSGR
jgi:DNA-directed RNA polymerase subunit RPC12/RpoP